MVSRYVYWRSPTGRPARGDSSKHAPSAVLAELGKISSITADGNVQWSGFSFNQLETALRSACVVLYPNGEELNEYDSWKTMHEAIVATTKKIGGQKPLPEKDVLESADAANAQYFRQPETQYTLVGSLSIETFPFKSVEINGCKISALTSRKAFPAPEQACRDPYIAEHLKSSKYQLVRVSVRGRTVNEAADRSISALNLMRGLWSLSATYGAWSISFFSSRREKPIGVIHPGPIYTLHYKNGKTVDDVFWYDLDIRADRKIYRPTVDRWKRIEATRRWLMSRLKKHPFRSDLEPVIVRYVRALDQTDHDVAFLQIWSILEQVTDTVGNYDETIKRTAWPYEDRPLVKDFLECMRARRNLYVHTARTSNEADQAVYLIKQFVDHHLVRAINNHCKATRMDEYAKHLARPTDLDVLRKERRAIDLAIRTLTPRSLR